MSYADASRNGGHAAAATNRTLRLRTVVDVRLHITWDARGEHPATQLLGDCGHVLDTWPGDQVRTARVLYLDPDYKPRRKRCPQCPR